MMKSEGVLPKPWNVKIKYFDLLLLPKSAVKLTYKTLKQSKWNIAIQIVLVYCKKHCNKSACNVLYFFLNTLFRYAKSNFVI